MSEPFDTALRERIARLPADPPAGWPNDLRARLETAWADRSDAAAGPATVIELRTRARRGPRRLGLAVVAAATVAAAGAALLNVGDSRHLVKTEVPPAGSDQTSVTAAADPRPSNGQLLLVDGSGIPRRVDTDGASLPPVRCAEPCPGGNESLWEIADADRWSPDGKQAVYGWNYGLYVLDVESGATRRVAGPCAGTDPIQIWDGTITAPPGPGNPSWSPDGSRILYECRGLHVVSLDNDDDVLVADPCELSSLGCGNGRAPDYYYTSGRWSPDGRSIAVTVEDPPSHTRSLHIVDASTRSHRVVASQGEVVAWAPDGRLVYWRGDRGELTSIDGRLTYQRPVDELRAIDSNGKDTLIARVPHGEVAPDLAHVAYLTEYHEGRAEGRDVRVRDLVSGADVLIQRGEHRYEGVAWSPDGTRLAVVTDERVVIVDPDGSDRVTLPQTASGGLAWLPEPAR